MLIKFSGKYIYSGTRQLNIFGYLRTHLDQHPKDISRHQRGHIPCTAGHQKDICWHLCTDGRISYQYSSTQEPQRHSHTTRITKCKFAMTLNACEERPLQILMSKCWNLKTSKFTDTQRQNKIRVPTFGGCGFKLIQ